MKNPRVVKMPWIICVIYLCTNILDASILICLRDPSCKKKSDMWYRLVKSQQKRLFMFSNSIACNTESILIILAGK